MHQIVLARGNGLKVYYPQILDKIWPILAVPVFLSASSSESATSPTSGTHAAPTGNNRIAVLEGHVNGSAGTLSSDYDSVSGTAIAEAVVGSIRTRMWWIDDANLPNSGSPAWNISFTGTVTHLIGAIMTFNGAEQSVDDSNTNTAGAVTSISTSVNPTVGNSMGVDICGVQDAGNITNLTPTSSQTERWTETDFDADASGSDEIPIGPAANTHSYSFNGTSQAAGIVAAAFGPAAGTNGKAGFMQHNW